MNSKNAVINAYKGLFYHFLLDLRKTAIIGVIIILSLAVFDFLMAIIFISLDETISNEASGIIFMGGIVMLIAFMIHIMLSTAREEMHGKFAFPINRNIYAISNFVFIIVGAFTLLALVTIISPVEILLYEFLELTTNKMFYMNQVSLKSFVVGFTAMWAYMIFFGSLTYGIFMYIRKYTIYALPVLTIAITSVFAFGWFGDIIAFFFLEDSLPMLLIKLIGLAIVSNVLGFIPLKRLEVQ